LVGIWIIIFIQKPCHHFLHTVRSLRMFKSVFRDHFILNSCLCFVCYGWSAQTSPKRWFGKHEYGVILWRHKQRIPNTNDTIWQKLTTFPNTMARAPQRRGAQCSCIGWIALRPTLHIAKHTEVEASYKNYHSDI